MEITIPSAASRGSFGTLLEALELLELTNLIGDVGQYSAFTIRQEDMLVYHVIPGRFSSDEFLDLVNVLEVSSTTDQEKELYGPRLLLAAQ